MTTINQTGIMTSESSLLAILLVCCLVAGLFFRADGARSNSAESIGSIAAVLAATCSAAMIFIDTNPVPRSVASLLYLMSLSGLLASGFILWYGIRVFSSRKLPDWLLLASICLGCAFIMSLNQVIALSPQWPLQTVSVVGLVLVLFNLRELLHASTQFSCRLVSIIAALVFTVALYRTATLGPDTGQPWHNVMLYLLAVILLSGALAMIIISALQQQLVHLSSRDQLTNALNRKAFYERAKIIHSIAQRDRKPAAVVIVDIDYFRDINEEYGQKLGDRLLKHLLSVISSTFREQDLFARYGGEEFIALLPDTNVQQARVAMSRLQLNLSSKPLYIAHQELTYTVSIGVCIGFCGDLGLEEMVISAEEAMQEAKAAGRDRVIIHQQNSGLSLVKTEEDARRS